MTAIARCRGWHKYRVCHVRVLRRYYDGYTTDIRSVLRRILGTDGFFYYSAYRRTGLEPRHGWSFRTSLSRDSRLIHGHSGSNPEAMPNILEELNEGGSAWASLPDLNPIVMNEVGIPTELVRK